MTTRHAIVLALAVLVADVARGDVLCRGKGDRLTVRESCRKRERAVDPATFAVSGPAGAPGAPGDAGADATSPLRLVDANGTEIGPILFFHPVYAIIEIDAPLVPAAMLIPVTPAGFLSDSSFLRYSSTDCSGVAFMRPNFQDPTHVHPPLANVYGTAAYYGTGEIRSMTHNSTETRVQAACPMNSVATTRGTCCTTQTDMSFNVVPTARVPLDGLGLQTPFRAVPR